MNQPTDHRWRPPPFNHIAAAARGGGGGGGPHQQQPPPFPPPGGRGGPRMMGNINNSFHRGGPNFRGGPTGRGGPPGGPMLIPQQPHHGGPPPPPPPPHMIMMMMNGRGGARQPPAMPGRGPPIMASGRPQHPMDPRGGHGGGPPPPPSLGPPSASGRIPVRGGGRLPPGGGRGLGNNFPSQQLPPFHHHVGGGPLKNGQRPLHSQLPPPPPPPLQPMGGALGGGGRLLPPGMPGRGQLAGRGGVYQQPGFLGPPPPHLLHHHQQQQKQQQQHPPPPPVPFPIMPINGGGRGLGLAPPPPPPPPPMANHMRHGLAPNNIPVFPLASNHLPPVPVGVSHGGGHLIQQRQSTFVNNAPSLQHPFAQQPARQHQPQQQQPQQQQQHGPIGPLQATALQVVGPVTANGGSSTPTTTTASFTKKQEDQAWTEHDAPDGRKYYHNSLTKQSVYEKPACLKVKDTTTTALLVERPWAEYEDPGTGKKYYSNGIVTQWTKPTVMEQAENTNINNNNDSNIAASSSDHHQVNSETKMTTTTAAVAAPAAAEASSLVSKKRRRAAAPAETEFHNKEEATAAFKGLLLAKDITPVHKWNEVIKICLPDARWEACENVLSTGERKQALAEYQTKRANDLRTIERQERQRTREAFVQLLSEMLPSVPGFSARSSRFEDVRAVLTKDDRFHAVADEATRESLFLDFCEEFRKHEERKRRSKRRDAQDNFLSFLKENEESGRLTYASTWNSFVASLGDDDKRDVRFEVSNHMSDAERQLYFADFVIELQTQEDDKRRRIRDARRRAEKAQREAYRDTLTKLAEAKEIVPTSRWRDLDARLSMDPTYGPLNEQDREAPREIFQEFVDDWSESYRRDRSILGRIANQTSLSKKTTNAAVTKDLSYDQFSAALLEAAVDSAEELHELRRIMNEKPISSARLYFDEIRQRVSSRRGSLRQRDEESSEDEGEIVEDGEVENGSKKLEEKGPGHEADVSAKVDV